MKFKNLNIQLFLFIGKLFQWFINRTQVNSYLIIFKANYLLNFDGISGDILILSPRFKEGDFESIATKEVDVNGGLFLDDYSEGFEENKLKKNCKFVLIGTLDSWKIYC